MMQAIQITTFLPDEAPYSSLKPSLIPKPLPKDDQVLVRITHVALQQVDLLFSRGKHQENNARLGHVHPPFVLGMEWAGVVESLPLGNTSKHQLTVGDRVMGQCYGAFAEYLCCTPVSQARKIAADMSSAAAATLSGGLVSYAAVHEKAQVKAGDTVLVSGANGGLGVVACQIAKAIGARVIALVSTEDKAEYLRKHIDLDHVVAMGTDKEWIKTVNSITQGKGVNSVIDNIGMVEDGLRCVKFGGRIVVVGFAGRNGVMEKVPMNKILLKGAVVIGYRMGEERRQMPEHMAETSRKEYDEYLRHGNVKALIDSRQYNGIESIPQALQDLADRRLQGKAVVSIGGAERSRL